MNVVIDTNVLVSGLINPDGNPARIMNMVLNLELNIIYDTRIISEYADVLHREKFGFSSDIIDPLIEFLKMDGISVIPFQSNVKFIDEHDKKFYEAAKSGHADFLITGNKKHFPKEKFIVSPAEFLESINKK